MEIERDRSIARQSSIFYLETSRERERLKLGACVILQGNGTEGKSGFSSQAFLESVEGREEERERKGVREQEKKGRERKGMEEERGNERRPFWAKTSKDKALSKDS